MTVNRKEKLLRYHALARMRLNHAASVDSYEFHGKNNRMPVNRLLFVCSEDAEEESVIYDLNNALVLPMKAGHLYFIPHNYLIDLDLAKNISFVSLQFNLDLFGGIDVFETYPRCEVEEDRLLGDELRVLMEHENELRTLCRVNEIIFHLCSKWTEPGLPCIHEKMLKSQKYERVMEYVRNHGNATTTVEKLADMNGMRRDVFSRTFTADMGITPKSFISNSLLRKASEMLLTPSSSVSSVARELEFSSEFYFSHFFKRLTGVSPKHFKKMNGC